MKNLLAIDWAYEKPIACVFNGEKMLFKGDEKIEKLIEFLQTFKKKVDILLEEGCLYELKELLSGYGDVYLIPGKVTKLAREEGGEEKTDEVDAGYIYQTPREKWVKFEGLTKALSYLSELIKQRDRLSIQKVKADAYAWLYGVRAKLNEVMGKADKSVIDVVEKFLLFSNTADKSINKLDYKIGKLTGNHLHDHPLIKNGLPVKGFGAVSLAKVICYYKDVNRFSTLGKWRAHSGLCPPDGTTKKAVDTWRQKTKKNRTLMFQFFQSSIKVKNKYWKLFRRLRDKVGMRHGKARNRVMTKICEDLFKMWKFGDNYRGAG